MASEVYDQSAQEIDAQLKITQLRSRNWCWEIFVDNDEVAHGYAQTQVEARLAGKQAWDSRRHDFVKPIMAEPEWVKLS